MAKVNILQQTVEVRNELLEAPIITEGPNKGKTGDINLVENAPIIMDGPNRGKILPKSFKSIGPDNEYGLTPGLYAYDKFTGDILCNKPIHPWRDNAAVTRTGQPSSQKVYVENPLGLMEKMNKMEAELAAMKVERGAAKAEK